MEAPLNKITVRLDCGTVGTFNSDYPVEEGCVVTVGLHDENGNPLRVTGTVVEILETTKFIGKTIVIQWVKKDSFYEKAMRVIVSDHPRFTVGYRFDFGFMSIATDEGYTIVSVPMQPSEKEVVKKTKN